jgi:hypothetical protein
VRSTAEQTVQPEAGALEGATSVLSRDVCLVRQLTDIGTVPSNFSWTR